MNKKAMSISIVLLTISTIVLINIILFSFITYEGKYQKILEVPNTIDETYILEGYLNFYLNEIFEKTADDFNPKNGKEIFISRFKDNLQKYKDEKGNYFIKELKNFEKINRDNIEFINENGTEKLRLNLNTELFKIKKVSEKVVISVRYKYEKSFEKSFKD